MFCTNCGKELPDGTKFCTKCGKPVRQPPTGKDEFPDLEGIASQKQQEAIPIYRRKVIMPKPVLQITFPARYENKLLRRHNMTIWMAYSQNQNKKAMAR